MNYTIEIVGSFTTPRALATELRRIAYKLDHEIKNDASFILKNNEEELKEIDERLTFGLTIIEWTDLQKVASEYMSQNGLNDTITWLMQKQSWSNMEARSFVNEMKHEQ